MEDVTLETQGLPYFSCVLFVCLLLLLFFVVVVVVVVFTDTFFHNNERWKIPFQKLRD